MEQVESLGERLEALSLELQDATEDLNDLLRDAEEYLLSRSVRPGWVPIPSFDVIRRGRVVQKVTAHAFLWDGRRLLYDHGPGQPKDPILSAPRGARIRAGKVLSALCAELVRERSVPND